MMLIFGVVDEARDHGLSPEIVVQLIPYIFPKALMFAMPATCLFSVCVVFGRLAADNELVAIQSLGLHPSVVIVPALVVAFFLSLFAVWVNDVSFAWSHWGIAKVVRDSSDKIVFDVLKNEGVFKMPKFSIAVDGVTDGRLIHPVIEANQNGDNIRAVAHEATLTSDPNSHGIRLTMYRGVVTHAQSAKEYRFPVQSYDIPLQSQEDIEKATGNPSHLYLHQIASETRRQNDELTATQRANAVRACTQLLMGDLVGLTSDDWQRRQTELADAEQRLGRLKVVPHRRWANGFSCFAFAIIGIPVALRLRSANYATTFGVCFLPILAIYYPLFMFGLNNAKMGTLPPYAAWLGNVACILIGAVMLHREFRR